VATGKELVFLVDTDADISIVKENSYVFHDIKDNYIIDIKGIIKSQLNSKEDSVLNPNQEIKHGIYRASTIVE